MAVPDGTYTVIAFIDADDNGRLDGPEVWIESSQMVTVPPGATDIALDLDAWVAPGTGGDDAADEGCCATLAHRERTPIALLLLALAFGAVRRR